MSEMLLVTNFVIGVNLVGSNAGIGRAIKKVRWQPNLLPDIDDPTVDENGRKLLEAIMAKVSYKNTRVGFSTTCDSSQKVKDFELQKGNLRYQKLELMGECNELSINLYPNVCFRCGLYGHSFDSCPKNRPSPPMNDIAHSSLILEIHDLQRRVEDQNYGL
ncbi:hypothetical protein Goarm_020788 [Gossypium armourianum]|uniref:CCHC-type domain-containing protein n=1 Tax=Gossypium armourianum TaxID=34283 RepID=A0A7J9IR63_9ROSI|nr:hypothetical protein [Gossypium armourianum]